ncbi:hypothetical protein [Streptomyces sp. NBC_00316]|uniref:hypothetical protein n=1 Tax=Streptomyces sp. NBC_00316 TaxID=2975710 RepID=UPI002E2A83F7|nr:hypothetical protein [Streptomyces sp. NBC_00316]
MHSLATPQSGRDVLDPHLDRYAVRTAGMTASEIRSLFAVASRPEVVSPAGGVPNLAALPLESLSTQVAQIIGPFASGLRVGWVPEGVDTKAMLPRAVSARVAYASGSGFHTDQSGSRQMRLSYCYPTPERIHEGKRRLAAVLESEMNLARTFAGVGSHRIPGSRAPSPDTV